MRLANESQHNRRSRLSLTLNRHTLNFCQPLRYRLLVSKRMCALIATLTLRTKSADKTPKRSNLHPKMTYAEIERETQERHKAEIEALESKNNALEAKISDFNQKQCWGITKDDFNDLKANYINLNTYHSQDELTIQDTKDYKTGRY